MECKHCIDAHNICLVPVDLKLPLEKYIQKLDTVRLIRTSGRLGVIQARNLGALYARGDILIFLDSHVECFPGKYYNYIFFKNIFSFRFIFSNY